MANWLGAAYGATLTLRPDLDQIEALAPEREASCRRQASSERTRLEKATFLTDDEKRSAAGYGPKPPAPMKFNPYHDDAGRFDFSPDQLTAPSYISPGNSIAKA